MTDWRELAACRGFDPELWFPIGSLGPALEQADRARRVCAACPVQIECLEWALGHGVEGIWGGTDENERRAVRLTIA